MTSLNFMHAQSLRRYELERKDDLVCHGIHVLLLLSKSGNWKTNIEKVKTWLKMFGKRDKNERTQKHCDSNTQRIGETWRIRRKKK